MTADDKKEFKQLMVDTLADFWESVFPTLATKQDIQEIRQEMASKQDLHDVKQELKQDINSLDRKVNMLARDVKEIRGRIIDVEGDTPTRSEFKRLENRVNELTN